MLTPPKPKVPPLNALRAFESAARLGGFSLAARELNVTPGAIAQQVKVLEGWAGATLFERMTHGVRLTELGKSTVDELGSAFDTLGKVALNLRDGGTQNQIRIAVLPSIAQLWLSPRLPQIRAIDPLTTISITALDRPPNLLREPYDLSLFFCAEKQPGNGNELCRDKIFPVCAPSMASRLKQPSDLRGLLFLHDARWINDWQSWLNQVAPGHGIDTSGPSFSLYSLAQQEAENGAGILIGHEILVQDSLRKGSLVAPFGESLEIDQTLMCATPAPARPDSVIEKIIRKLAQDTKAHIENIQ